MPPGSTAIFLQGTASASGGAGTVFGDGLLCLGGSMVRLGTKHNSTSGASGYGPALGDPPVSVRGHVPAAGGTRFYQIDYRDSASFCTPSTFNLSNGLRVVWIP